MAGRTKLELEYIIKSSPTILYNRLSSPSGLAEWFADDVNNKKGIFTFEWDGSEEEAKLISKKQDDHIRWQWIYDEDEDIEYYFEFKIKIDPLTKEVALIVTDFIEPSEVAEQKMLWTAQIDELMALLGS